MTATIDTINAIDTINTDNLTLGQARELASLFGRQAGAAAAGDIQAVTHPFVGMYAIARCYAAGVHAGTVISVDGENVVLENSRRLWSWTAAEGVALSGVAQHGIKKDACKIDTMNPLIYLTGVAELIPCSKAAAASIQA